MLKKLLAILKSNNFLSFAGNMIFALLGFVNFALLSKSLSENDFAEWIIYISGLALVEMIRSGLTGTPLVRFLAGSSDKHEEAGLLGASWVLSGIVTAVAIILIYSGLLLFNGPINEKGFGLFFLWYPVLSVVVLPLNTAYSVLQARSRFGDILLLRTINMGSFFIFLLLNFLWLKLDVFWVLMAHIITFSFASVFSMLKGWSGIRHFFKAKRAYIKEQFNFGRFSLGTLLGSNLLKSSDTFIIGIMMTKPEVAYYSVPLKLIEVIEIPIRSMVAVAFPKMSQESRKNRNFEVKRVFYSYTGLTTLLFIPMVVVLFFLAKPLTILLGDEAYIQSYTIFWIFLIYALFLPMDRFSGIALDAINKPKLNMIKVFLMASANIIGDILVIHFFGSLELVAVITIVNVLVGVLVGNLLLNRALGTKILHIFPAGFELLRKQLKEYLPRVFK